jgi:hypothetical protein
MQSDANTYLVEHYRPGLRVGQLRECVTGFRVGLQTQFRIDPSTRLLCSVIVPDDEAFLVVLRAGSEQQVADVLGRAGVAFDRISVAIADLESPCSPHRS